MARVNRREEIVIELDLTVEEARFLRDLCQNHLSDCPEPDEMKEIRTGLFDELKGALG